MSRPTSNFAVLFLWLALQALALLASAAHLPLSAKVVHPGESLALHTLLVTQIGLASLLFPLLFKDFKCSAMVIFTAWPLAAMAGFLAAADPARTALAAAYTTTWLIALASWRYVLQSDKSQLIGVAIAGAIAGGGGVLWYLGIEFAGGWATPGLLGPIVGSLTLLNGTPPASSPWLVPGVLLFAGLLAAGLKSRHLPR